jgi:hypothetical protein
MNGEEHEAKKNPKDFLIRGNSVMLIIKSRI